MNLRPDRRGFLAGLAAHSLLFSKVATASAQPTSSIATDREVLLGYFAKNARALLREPAGLLKYPSISPSLPKAAYSSELWDWDTLWTARGLFAIAKQTSDTSLRQAIVAHAQGSIGNFFDHQSSEGRIPMLIKLNDPDPLHCLSGSRPHKENQAKPVLAQLALLATEESGDAAWFAPYMEKLQRFYDSWTADNTTKVGLLVWGDDVAIGNDNDPTTFGRPFFSSANLLLNCLYYEDLKAAAEMARKLGKKDAASRFASSAKQLGEAVQRQCWDPRDKFFYTVDVQCQDRRAELIPNIKRGMDMSWSAIPIRIQTFTGFLPLWCDLATKEQAEDLRQHFLNPATFGGKYGVRTLSRAENMYSLAASSNPSNWLGPVWIIANYFVWNGLRQYGFTREAEALAAATTQLLAQDLRVNGSLNEYYDPDTGKALSHRGFMDWNLLVLEMQ
ncbi:trehalase family glycosidase [Terriglobus sp. 2YAB30_2]|uniref:MGH1-like glycoside hydrolase domain-containing protein n=1 Tax=Terriglobus sp. 2YAB30_2 TaxID=3233023 RepID=UPI003F97B637